MLPRRKYYEKFPRSPYLQERASVISGSHASSCFAMNKAVRILGIDPGLQCVGFGVIDSLANDLTYVASGTITTTHLPRDDLPARLQVTFGSIAEVSTALPPCRIWRLSIVFVNMNPRQSQFSHCWDKREGQCLAALVHQSFASC
jgi:crossover junction endodeoxyribonuclease RuvC